MANFCLFFKDNYKENLKFFYHGEIFVNCLSFMEYAKLAFCSKIPLIELK